MQIQRHKHVHADHSMPTCNMCCIACLRAHDSLCILTADPTDQLSAKDEKRVHPSDKDRAA